jgi:exodeoxyribonuclease-3
MAPLRIVTANVNGIRAAQRRGGIDWLAKADADVICLQEVRATTEQLLEVLAGSPLEQYSVAHAPAETLGRAGVAVLSRLSVKEVRIGTGTQPFDSQGRWIETDLSHGRKKITVVSAYFHSGEAGTVKQDEKMAHLGEIDRRMRDLVGQPDVVVCGDLNIAHREVDIKNWKGNRDKAGFLPEERAYLDTWFGSGWSDLGRMLGGEGPGPYTWWSWRGRGFDTDGGWRIDYALATQAIAKRAHTATVGKAATYAERWSDHAPLTIEFG